MWKTIEQKVIESEGLGLSFFHFILNSLPLIRNVACSRFYLDEAISDEHRLILILCNSPLIKIFKSSIWASKKILSIFFFKYWNLEKLKLVLGIIILFLLFLLCVCVFVFFVHTNHCSLLLDKDFYFICETNCKEERG